MQTTIWPRDLADSPAPRSRRNLPGLAIGLIAASLVATSGASASMFSDSRKERIEKAYAKFLEKGAIPGKDVPTIPWAQAVQYQSRYYKVQTNTSADVASYIGMLMDAQAIALRKIFQFRTRPKKINIWATRTRRDFMQVAATELGIRIGPGTGGFWTTARGGTICLPYVKEGGLHPGNVMMHEATHQFLNAAIGRNLPIWMNEGLAVLFEESKYNPIEKKLEVFIVPRGRLRRLQYEMSRGAHVTLDRLFKTPQRMFSARYYGAAWSFLYWIFRSAGDDYSEGLRRQKAINKYLFDIKAGKTDVARLFGYLGMEQDEAEKEWKAWVLKLDGDDERGGTRLKGEPPYVPKPKKPREKKDSPGEKVSGSMQEQLEALLKNPSVPEGLKDAIRKKLSGEK